MARTWNAAPGGQARVSKRRERVKTRVKNSPLDAPESPSRQAETDGTKSRRVRLTGSSPAQVFGQIRQLSDRTMAKWVQKLQRSVDDMSLPDIPGGKLSIPENVRNLDIADSVTGFIEKAKSGTLSESEGRTLLLIVPFMWGTYNPMLRFIYASPQPPCPSELSFIRLAFATAAFWPAVAPMWAEAQAEGGLVEFSKRSEVKAGFELALWNFAGTAFQAWGLDHTTATRAGFLLAVTSALVPVGARLQGERVGVSSWLACGLALVGVLVMNEDALINAHQLFPASTAAGDTAMLLSACSYAGYTVRLSSLSPVTPSAARLAGIKSCFLLLFCFGWFFGDEVWRALTDNPSAPFVRWLFGAGLNAVPVLGAIVWSSVISGALATVLQTKGQSIVPAPQAQLIFSTTPVWTAVVASAVLGETVRSETWLGGAVLIAASLVPVLLPDPEEGTVVVDRSYLKKARGKKTEGSAADDFKDE